MKAGDIARPASSRLYLGLCILLCPVVGIQAEDPKDFTGISGSVMYEGGYLGLKADIPDEAARDWYSLSSASLRLSREDGATSFFGKLWSRFDAATGLWELSLDEAWYEWRATRGEEQGGDGAELGLRFGRSLLGFGPCLAFGPANPYIAKDGFDSRASQVGLDGIFLECALPLSSGEGASFLSLIARTALILPTQAFGRAGSLPAANGPPDVADSSANARLTLFAPGFGLLGPVELGLTANLHRVGIVDEAAENLDAGAWMSTEIGGFVVGGEGAIRTPSHGYAFSINRRMGDFFALAEAGYEDSDGGWLGFGRTSWASEEGEISLSALLDFETLALRSSLEGARNLGDSFVLRASLGWNQYPEKWKPALPADWLMGIALECFL